MPTQQTFVEEVPELRGAERVAVTAARVALSYATDRLRGAIRVRAVYHHGDRHLWRRQSGLANKSTLRCEKCEYAHMDVHRTGTSLITYCQQCGDDTESKRDDIRERWTEDQRKTRQTDLGVIQGGKKKKKRRQAGN